MILTDPEAQLIEKTVAGERLSPEEGLRLACAHDLAALGRGAEYYDTPVVRKIVRDSASGNYRWSSIILGIVKSTPFQMRRSDS